MSLFFSKKHWLAPLVISLFPFVTASAEGLKTHASLSGNKSVSVQTDNDGGISLQVSKELLTTNPETLKDALMEVVLGQGTLQAEPTQIDENGNLHYLLKMEDSGKNSVFRLKPLDSVADISSQAATGLAALLTLTATHYLPQKYTSGTTNFASGANDSWGTALLKNYARQSVLITSFYNGQAAKDTASGLLNIHPDKERTTWGDIIPEAASAAVMLGTGDRLHNYSDVHSLRDIAELPGHVSTYHTSSAATAISNMVRRAHEAALNDFTSLDTKTIRQVSHVASIVETAIALIASRSFAHPHLTDYTSSFAREKLPASLAIGAVYSFRDLVSDLATDYTDDQLTADMATTATMAAISLGTYALNRYTSLPLMDKRHPFSYGAIVFNMSAEAAGFSAGLGLRSLITKLTGLDDNNLDGRLTNTTTLLGAALAMHTLAHSLPAGSLFQSIMGNVATGTIIANIFEAFELGKEKLLKPYVIKPALAKAGITKRANKPSLSLRAEEITAASMH